MRTTNLTSTYVTAVLCSYSYRNTPFYCRTEPDNAADKPGGWSGYMTDADLADWTNPYQPWIAEWTLEGVKPAAKVQFMTPPFKTLRALKNRAIVSDTFDYASPTVAANTFTKGNGLGVNHHKNIYNILYGDGHVDTLEDSGEHISNWPEADWCDPANLGTDNFTISSPSSQRVWHLFDNQAGIDQE